MPRSTEQILFPERYQSGDRPIELAFSDPAPATYEDVLGEFDVRLLVQELTGRSAMENVVPLGWGGDRFRLDAGASGTGLVWIAVWDEPRYRDGFVRLMADPLRARAAKGYRVALDTLTVDGLAALRYAIGDSSWVGWGRLPHARVKQ